MQNKQVRTQAKSFNRIRHISRNHYLSLGKAKKKIKILRINRKQKKKTYI